MDRTEVFDLMGTLKLYGMRAAYDEVMAVGIKRRLEPARIVIVPVPARESGPGCDSDSRRPGCLPLLPARDSGAAIGARPAPPSANASLKQAARIAASPGGSSDQAIGTAWTWPSLDRTVSAVGPGK